MIPMFKYDFRPGKIHYFDGKLGLYFLTARPTKLEEGGIPIEVDCVEPFKTLLLKEDIVENGSYLIERVSAIIELLPTPVVSPQTVKKSFPFEGELKMAIGKLIDGTIKHKATSNYPLSSKFITRLTPITREIAINNRAELLVFLEMSQKEDKVDDLEEKVRKYLT